MTERKREYKPNPQFMRAVARAKELRDGINSYDAIAVCEGILTDENETDKPWRAAQEIWRV